ncbi:F210B protein, partial [Pseudoatta argentina]
MQCATSAAVHRKQQPLHFTSARYYPDPPTLTLPNNVCDIFANETGRFTPERARDIALYTENGDISVSTTNCSGFPKIRDDSHVDSYDCFGAVSLNGTMQTNVPKPFSSCGKSMHLNMPGGQWSRDDKYIAEDMQRSHYRKLSCTATNSFITSPLLRATYWPIYTTRISYSNNTSKDSQKDQATVPVAMMSKREKFRLLLRDYGSTLLAFHITISLISLGGCYMVVVSGIDVTPFVQQWTGENEQVKSLLKVSTDFIIAYTVHKLLAPVRIGISLSVTPVLVNYLRKIGLLKMSKKKSVPTSTSIKSPPTSS